MHSQKLQVAHYVQKVSQTQQTLIDIVSYYAIIHYSYFKCMVPFLIPGCTCIYRYTVIAQRLLFSKKDTSHDSYSSVQAQLDFRMLCLPKYMSFPTHVWKRIGKKINEMCRKFCPILHISFMHEIHIFVQWRLHGADPLSQSRQTL